MKKLAAISCLVIGSGAAMGQCAPYWRAVPRPAGWLGLGGQLCTALNSGGQEVLVIGGGSYGPSGPGMTGVAMFDGSAWTTLPGVRTSTRCMTTYHGELYIAGEGQITTPVVSAIVKWDGTQWVMPGPGVMPMITAMAVYRDELYLAGNFAVIGGQPMPRLTRWNGSTYSGVGNNQHSAGVMALGVHNDKLVIAASGSIGGVFNDGLTTWDGTNFAAIPGQVHASAVRAIASWRNHIIVGGFTGLMTGVSSPVVAWDGTFWAVVGSMNGGQVNALTVDDAGRLYAGGNFGAAGNEFLGNVAVLDDAGAWRGMRNSQFGPIGVSGFVNALCPVNGSVGVVGGFSNAGGTGSQGVAIWGPCDSDFNCDKTTDFFDYLDFVQAFSSQDPAADFNHDSVVDQFDYLDFVQAFGRWCW